MKNIDQAEVQNQTTTFLRFIVFCFKMEKIWVRLHLDGKDPWERKRLKIREGN